MEFSIQILTVVKNTGLNLNRYSNGGLNTGLAIGQLPAIVKSVIRMVPLFKCPVFISPLYLSF